MTKMNDKAFCFLIDGNGKDYIYNLYTGIKFEIDSYSKDMIYNCYENITEYEELYETLIKNSFINVENDDLGERIPIVSPYIIWNKENIVYPDINGVYKIQSIYENEYIFLDKINAQSSLREILSRLENINLSNISRLISYEMQCVKLVEKNELESAELYFDCPGAREFVHEDEEIIDNNVYYEHILQGLEEVQFENFETTISYMLRDKTKILNNRSFGECFIMQILKRYHIGPNFDILEVGGGLADMADAILGYLSKKKIGCTYTICDNSSALSYYQKNRLEKNI